jgi:hypothetical protein
MSKCWYKQYMKLIGDKQKRMCCSSYNHNNQHYCNTKPVTRLKNCEIFRDHYLTDLKYDHDPGHRLKIIKYGLK